MKTALIAGSTGLVGNELIKLLEDHPEYRSIHALVRNQSSLDSDKIIEHKIDFDDLDKFHPGTPIDHVFCTLGTTIKKAKTKENFRKVDFEYVYTLGKMSVQWGADKFLVVTALGANRKSRIFYNRVKGETEHALKELDLPTLFIFRPSLLLGERKEKRTAEQTAIRLYKVIDPLFFGRFKRYRGIEAKQVAKAMIQTALYNDTHEHVFESEEIQLI
jgi:uncharacterized protein YbjT (DUF2867 family)